jgi:hypothetical protein
MGKLYKQTRNLYTILIYNVVIRNSIIQPCNYFKFFILFLNTVDNHTSFLFQYIYIYINFLINSLIKITGTKMTKSFK